MRGQSTLTNKPNKLMHALGPAPRLHRNQSPYGHGALLRNIDGIVN